MSPTSSVALISQPLKHTIMCTKLTLSAGLGHEEIFAAS